MNRAYRRFCRGIAWYAGLAYWVCLVIGLALAVRHAQSSAYEGLIVLISVACAYTAGMLADRPK